MVQKQKDIHVTSNETTPQELTPRIASNTNNSDDEETVAAASKKEDFVSFPTLAEPEVQNEKSLSGLITKTLRKVTNNATNLVQNYSANLEPHKQYVDGTVEELKAGDTPSNPSFSKRETRPSNSGLATNGLDKGLKNVTEITSKHKKAEYNQNDLDPDAFSIKSKRHDDEVVQGPVRSPRLRSSRNSTAPATTSALQSNLSPGIEEGFVEKGKEATRQENEKGQVPRKHFNDAPQSPHEITGSINESSRPLLKDKLSVPQPSTSDKIRQLILEETSPRVTSDNKSLRLSTMPFPHAQSLSPRATSSVVSVNALATVDMSDAEHQSQSSTSQGYAKAKDKKSKRTFLGKKISTLFNNLPNDIEVSDDSASDQESVGDSEQSARVSTDVGNEYDAKIYAPNLEDNEVRALSTTYDMGTLHGGSIAKSSPIKVERTSKMTTSTVSGESPTVSSFQAIQSKDVHASRKRSQNFPSLILDNAKTILNQNLGAVASSASSIVGKRKKKKSTKISQNPLKNGGIPKKYWMDDAFVADCLNCFKPFTAFRRKHHCRFCGQIFCSDCTLFISYTQHRDQRNNVIDQKRPYYDKLRVCKPCYSDVIIYLSDDSSETETDDEADKTTDEHNHPRSRNEDLLVPNHPLSRVRSLSTTSYRDSIGNNETSQGSISHDSKIKDSGSISSFSPSRKNSQHIYPDESIKANQKQAPRMAIPTTRAGESIEIPLMRNSLTNAQVVRGPMSKFGSSSKLDIVDQNSVSNSFHQNLQSHNQFSVFHNHAPSNFAQTSYDILTSNKAWLKNSESFLGVEGDSTGNQSAAYKNLVSRKPSLKLKVTPSFTRVERNHELLNLDDNDDADVEGSSSSSESENEASSARHLRNEDSEGEEDERAMSIYSSLNDQHAYGSTPLARNSGRIFGAGTGAVPTLGEFPGIKTFFSESRNNFPYSNIMKKNNITINEATRPESLRSRARANASIQRMRSRRQTRNGRNVSILTQNNIRLPSLGSTTVDRSTAPMQLSPSSSPSSPLPENLTRSNLTTAMSNTPEETINPRKRNDNFDEMETELSPISPRISNDTPLRHESDSSGYFGYHHPSGAQGTEAESRGDAEECLKLDKIYTDTLNGVLEQSLKDCEIENNFDQWVYVLQRVLTKVNMLKVSDTLDIRQYVKLKKILGGKIEQTEIVNGLFMTKDIDSKKMRSMIEKPSIALLMFPVEYLKDREQFISLRVIHAQQSVYITNLVSKLISLSPDIIVVGDTVCGLAIKLLEEAGITVVSNVKPQVIERISRYTNADIFQSVNDLFFKKGNLGVCDKFEVKRFRYGNAVKTFIFFTGIDTQLGFTIMLRGGDERLLDNVKYTAEVLIHGYLNARYEKSLLRNSLLTCTELSLDQSVNDIDQIMTSLLNDDLSSVIKPVLDNQEVVSYINSFKLRRLSLSPSVQYNLPTMLVKVVETYYRYFHSYKLDKEIQSLTSSDQVDANWKDQLKIKLNVDELPGKHKDFVRILNCASKTQLKICLDEYQSRARIWSNCLKYPSYQLFPIFHRNIYILHSTVSIKHATPCAGPAIVVVDYYTENDKCLGLFLDQIFSDSSKTCNECGELSLEHYKTYAHGNAKIDLITEKYDIKFNGASHESQGKNQRVMWSYCKQCNYVTPIMAMSDDTYYLSIGKFFELNYYGRGIFGGCEHDYFQNYVKCFGFNDLVVKMEYSRIDNYEIVVPKKQLEFICDINITLKVETFKSIKSKAEAFFESVSKRLSRVKLDTFVKAEDGTKKITEMKNKLAEDSNAIYTKLQKKYDEISVTSYLELNSIFKDLQVLGILWDIEFQEFEKKYLPNESEVNKITQFHLRKFLMDKYNVHENDKNDLKDANTSEEKPANCFETEGVKLADTEGDAKDGHSENQNKVLNVEQRPNVEGEPKIEKLSESRDEHDSGSEDVMNPSKASDVAYANPSKTSTNAADKPQVFTPRKGRTVSYDQREPDILIESKMFPKTSLYEPKTNISERISKWEETAADKALHQAVPLSHRGSDSSLKSVNTVIPSQNKVIHLANFFDKMYYDQISLEFSKQREFELKKRSKIKAQPILDSKPIVEIYNKIEDVVGSSENEEKKDINNNSNNTNQAETKTVEIKDTSFTNPQQEQTPKQIDIPEKQSLLKSLTNFWADRSATLWDPLAYPLDSHEHTFADSDVIVREDEPSSLVAFCLSSGDYKQKLKQLFVDESDTDEHQAGDDVQEDSQVESGKALVAQHQDAHNKMNKFVEQKQSQQKQQQPQEPQHEQVPQHEKQDQNQKQLLPKQPQAQQQQQQSQQPSQQQQHHHPIESGNEDTETDYDNRNESGYKTDFSFGLSNDNKKKNAQFAKIERKFKQKSTRGGEDGKPNQLETILNKAKSNHLKYQFSDGNTNLSCKIFYSEQFEALRRGCGVNNQGFIQSLSRCVKWHSSGGKSGSSFLKTLDNRYIVKELSKTELESFVAIAPFYFKYISQSMFNTLTTAIAKIFGFYQVEIKNHGTGKVVSKMDFLIMENLFYNHKTTRIFDLKGSMRNRHVQQTGKENEVLLDENMIEYIYESPVFVKEQSKKLLRGCLFNDTSFLSAMDVMDYSLVIGIDDESKKLYIGIIDWLRAFTWDKKVENWVKGNNLIGGGKKGKDPTVVTPKQYRIRFREAMERYILEVPDIWYEGTK
ncbi:unnamed protein product [Candida parapsilosis]